MSGFVNTNGYLREKHPSDPGYWDGDYPHPQRPTMAEDALTNIQMSDIHREHVERAEEARCVQLFIDNFESFLQELSAWRPIN